MFKFFGGEKPQIPNEVPFQKLEKIGEGKYSEVNISINDPDLVVKVARTKWKKGEEGVHPLANPSRMKADLDVLNENFGDFVPNTQLVIGKNEKGEKTVYTIQERIEGTNLDNIKFDEHIAEQLKSFLDKVIDTYIDNLVYYERDHLTRSIFPDLKGENFIFGKNKKRNEEGNKLYFVDTYPIEGAHLQDFIRHISFIQTRFAPRWQNIILEFREEAARKIKKYLQENKDKIERIA